VLDQFKVPPVSNISLAVLIDEGKGGIGGAYGFSFTLTAPMHFKNT